MPFSPKSAPGWQWWAGPLLVAVPITLIVLVVFIGKPDKTSEIESCSRGEGQRHYVNGKLRATVSSFFVQTDKWKLITYSCTGKNSVQCWERSPGLRALRDSVGQSIEVEFCEGMPISYRLNGHLYDIGFVR